MPEEEIEPLQVKTLDELELELLTKKVELLKGRLQKLEEAK